MNKQEKEQLISFINEAKEDLSFDFGKYHRTHYGYVLGTKVIAYIKQLDEPQKPVVTRFVADWFEKNKGDLEYAVWRLCVDSSGAASEPGIIDWFLCSKNKPIETLIRMQDGYEVEEEPKYEVVFREDTDDRFLLMQLNEYIYEIAPESDNDGYRSQWFTEKEIKAIDERYWPFAVPVEKV